MKIYADSSVLVPLYLKRDVQSRKANALMAQFAQPVLFTELNWIEIRNTIRLYRWRGWIDKIVEKESLLQLDEDLENKMFDFININNEKVCRKADELSEKHTGCKTLDLLHVATALEIRATHFLTFDARQKKLAKLVKLKVKP